MKCGEQRERVVDWRCRQAGGRAGTQWRWWLQWRRSSWHAETDSDQTAHSAPSQTCQTVQPTKTQSWLTWDTDSTIKATTQPGKSLRQTFHTHRASVHQAAKLVAAFLMVARVTAGLAESNGSLPLGLWLTPPARWLRRTGISSGTLHSVIEYGLPFPFFAPVGYWHQRTDRHKQQLPFLLDFHYLFKRGRGPVTSLAGRVCLERHPDTKILYNSSVRIEG